VYVGLPARCAYQGCDGTKTSPGTAARRATSASAAARSDGAGTKRDGDQSKAPRFTAIASAAIAAAGVPKARARTDSAAPAAMPPKVIAGMYAFQCAHCVAQPMAPMITPAANMKLQ